MSDWVIVSCQISDQMDIVVGSVTVMAMTGETDPSTSGDGKVSTTSAPRIFLSASWYGLFSPRRSSSSASRSS